MINFGVIGKLLGLLLMITGGLMLTGIPFALYYGTGDAMPLLLSAAITALVGLLLRFFMADTANNAIRKREGYLIVTLGWTVMSLFGALPYVFSNAVPGITDAIFESISGFTTTGASVIPVIEDMPRGLLFWRSMTQWIGGMGIIVMTIAILPILGIGGMELFVAEAPGPTSDKIHPRIKETAKRLWAIYVLLTAVLLGLLWIGGMSFYDAFNHALTTMATGGFSTHSESMAYFPSPFLQYTVTLFMFLAATNYTLMYFGFKGDFRKFLQNEEFLTYAKVTGVMTLLVTVGIFVVQQQVTEVGFREAIFQVVSIITTTGFVTADYTVYTPAITVLFFAMMFFGGSAGSTSGGIKIVRHLAMAKNCLLEFNRLLHPRAVLPVKINQRIVSESIISNVLVFILLYVVIFVVSAVILSAFGLDFETAVGAVAATLGNIGPGLGEVGPVMNFQAVPMVGKWFLSALMVLGRLELFTVLILFTGYFWTSR